MNAQAAEIYEKIKEKEKLITKGNDLKAIKDIGKKMENSISEYFYKAGLNDPTTNFQWEYILIDNKKLKMHGACLEVNWSLQWYFRNH